MAASTGLRLAATLGSWELSSDYKSIKLNLRHRVQYQTGREFTSDDVFSRDGQASS